MVNTAIFVSAIFGNWCPLWWPSRWNFIYYLYSSFTYFILFTHVLSELINLILDINTLADFTNKCISLIPVINACCKGINVLINRRKIIAALNMLESDQCRVRNLREIYLQRKYKRWFRRIKVTCLILDLAIVIALLVNPFLDNFHVIELPFKAWFPFAVDTKIVFWTIFIYESIASFIAAGFYVASDLLVMWIILEICKQLDMLSGRLSHLTVTNFVTTRRQWIRRRDNYVANTSQDRKMKDKLIDCVDHHIFIFELADVTQECFVATFATQMITGLIGTCTSAYYISRHTVGSPNFNKAGFICLSSIFEVFLCCWFGNELRLKSLGVADAVYNMNWTTLKINLQMNLLNICMRARRPIIFTSGPAIQLSNQVFVGILQASYSAYTVLRKVGKSPATSTIGGTQTS